MRPILLALLLLLAAHPAGAQIAWPVAPRDASHQITGTFAEYRGPANPHFHSGVDVPKADGSPVYAVAGGRVVSLDRQGANAYVRVGRYAYVHIRPHPALEPGDRVAEGDVIGTILDGQGHVHFTDGYPGSEREPLAEGRLTPYHDPWAPELRDVQFYLQPTRQRLAPGALTGPVEVSVRVRERNGPPSAAFSRRNNGAHRVGYRVLTRDRADVVYTPSEEGTVFHFDHKPSDAYVHNVFDRRRGATTSDQIYLATSALTEPTAWDTDGLAGDYTLMLFAEDARGNADTLYVDVGVSARDLLPPPQVTLHHVTVDDAGRPTVAWTGGRADDLAGFRLYEGAEAALPTVLLQGEGVLGPDARAYTHAERLAAPTSFTVRAADGADPVNLAEPSDVYAAAPGAPRILVVDGFDRHTGSGSWQQPWHSFAATVGHALAAHGAAVSSAANEAVEGGAVRLEEHDLVVWGLGDESTARETFSSAEQLRVRAYLEAGGRLWVHGSEVAWDLGERGSAIDRAFLRDYLKVDYAGDDAGSHTVAGTAGGPFEGRSFQYGTHSSPYPEDYPDHFTPTGGSTAVLHYANDRVAAVYYAGPFGTSDRAGRVLTMGLPVETIHSPTWQRDLAGDVLALFFDAANPAEPVEPLPQAVVLEAPYPNPSSGPAVVPFALPVPARVRLDVYDLLGRRVAALADAAFVAGRHEAPWTAAGLAAGTYVLRLTATLPDGTTHRRVARAARL